MKNKVQDVLHQRVTAEGLFGAYGHGLFCQTGRFVAHKIAEGTKGKGKSTNC